jgi:hypothetical protein
METNNEQNNGVNWVGLIVGLIALGYGLYVLITL